MNEEIIVQAHKWHIVSDWGPQRAGVGTVAVDVRPHNCIDFNVRAIHASCCSMSLKSCCGRQLWPYMQYDIELPGGCIVWGQ